MNWLSPGKRRCAAIVTLVAFLMTNTIPADTAYAFFQTIASASGSIPSVGLSPQLGKVELSFPNDEGPVPAIIYHIQDAHGSLEAQKNIFEILSFLHKKKQLDAVFLEGAAGTLSSKALNPFKDAAKNRDFRDRLFQKGFINGAAKFLGENADVPAFGAEDPSLYRQNLDTYRTVYKSQPAIRNFLNSAEVRLAEDTKKIIDGKAWSFLKSWKLQQEKGEDLDKYLQLLFNYGKEIIGIDWDDYSLQKDWPQMTRIFRLLKAESKSDPVKLREEMRRFRSVLGGGVKAEMSWLQSVEVAAAVPAQDLRQKGGLPRKMAESLMREMQEKRISWTRYPELVRFLSFQILQSEIVPEILYGEVQSLERKIYEALGHRSQAANWLEFYRDFYLLKRALSLELRREEAARFRKVFGRNWSGSFKRFLGKETLPDENEIQSLVGEALKFYDQAESREAAFTNILSQKEKSLSSASGESSRPRLIVIVAGGYHKEGLEQKINGRLIPFGAITPRMTTGENLLPYQKLLMGDYSEISTLGPAQLGVMTGRSEAREMVGEKALEDFGRSLEKISHSIEASIPIKALQPQRRPEANFLGRIKFLMRIALLIGLAGILSGCADLGRGRARQQIGSDRQYTLPQRDMTLPGSFQVDENSLAEAVVTHDPVILKRRFQVNIREAEKGRLAGSISLMPTVGVADGKPVFGLGVEGTMPNLGAIRLTGLGVDTVATAALALAAEISKYWKGEDILARELARQMVDTARIELQQAAGERYLDFLGAAYEMKTLSEQGPVIEAALKAIDQALEVAARNAQSTAAKRREIEDHRMEWLLLQNENHAAMEKAAFPLRTLYAQNSLGNVTFSNTLQFVQFPQGWKATPDQRIALGLKATAREDEKLPANLELATAYQVRLSAATAARLSQRRNSFSLSIGGLSFFDSYGTKPPSVLKTKVIPEANDRTYNQDIGAVRAKTIFGGEEKANREVSLLEVRVAEADLQAVRDRIEERIAELLQTIEQGNSNIRIAKAENASLRDYLNRARKAGMTEDRLILEALKIYRNEMIILSSNKKTTLAAKELQVRTRDAQGLPKVLAGRSESRNEKSTLVYLKKILSATIGTVVLAIATLGMAFLLRPHLESVSWNSLLLSLGVNISWAGIIAAYCVWMQDHIRQGMKAFASKIYWKEARDTAIPAATFAAFFTGYYALIGMIDLSQWMGPWPEIALKSVVDTSLNYGVFYPLILLMFFKEVYREAHGRELLKAFKTRPYFEESRRDLLVRFLPVEILAMVVNKLVSPFLSELVILTGEIAFTWMALKRIERIHESGLQVGPGLGVGARAVRGIEKTSTPGRSESRSNYPDTVITPEMLVEASRRVEALVELNLSDSGTVRSLAHHAVMSLMDGGLLEDQKAKIPTTMFTVSLEIMTSAIGNTQIPEKQAMAAWAFAWGFIYGRASDGGVDWADMESIRQDLKQIASLPDTLIPYALAKAAISDLISNSEIKLRGRGSIPSTTLSDLTTRIRAFIEQKSQEQEIGIEEKEEASALAAGFLMQAHRFFKKSAARSESRKAEELSVNHVKAFGPGTKVKGLVYGVDLGDFTLELLPQAQDFLNRGLHFVFGVLSFDVKTPQNAEFVAPVKFFLGFGSRLLSWERAGSTPIPDTLAHWLDAQAAAQRPWTEQGFENLLTPGVRPGAPAVDGLFQRSEMRAGKRVRGNFFRKLLLAGAFLFMFVPAVFSGTPESSAELKRQEQALMAENQALEKRLEALATQERILQAENKTLEVQLNQAGAAGPAAAGSAIVQNTLTNGLAINSLAGKSVMEILRFQGDGNQEKSSSVPAVEPEHSSGPEKTRTNVVAAVSSMETTPLPEIAMPTKSAASVSSKGASVTNVSHTPKPSVVKTPAATAKKSVQSTQDHGRGDPSHPAPLSGTVIYKGKGQATVNAPGAILLTAPMKADSMVYTVKAGDIVKKGQLLATGQDTERDNRIQFLEDRIRALDGLLARGEKNPGTLDRDTKFQYQFEKTEHQLELAQLKAAQEADILVSPRAGIIQTVDQGPATAGSSAIQIVPLDEGIIKIALSPQYSGADDIVFSVNGFPVEILDWEASHFDLAKGRDGEFFLTLRFIFPPTASLGKHGSNCIYEIQLIKARGPGVGSAGRLSDAGFHTTVPPSQLTRIGVPPVPGIDAGVFHAKVQDGHMVKAGETLGEWIPVGQGGQIRIAKQLQSLAAAMRKANQEFETLTESALQGYEQRAQRAVAGTQRSVEPILIKAPVDGRIRGVTALNGQTLAAGQVTKAGVVKAEIFLGTSVDPRSEAWTGRLANEDRFLMPVKTGSVRTGDKVSVVTYRGVFPGEVFAVVPLANSTEWLLDDREGVVLRVNDTEGMLGEGNVVDISFDGAARASAWAKKTDALPGRNAPPLRLTDPIPASVQEEFQMRPGQKIEISRLMKLVWGEGNPTQRSAVLKYFMNPFGSRFISWHFLPVLAFVLLLWNLPKLIFAAVKSRGHKNFFRKDPAGSMEMLFDEATKIGSRLKRNANKQRAVRGDDVDMRVFKEIIEPLQAWTRLLLENEHLSAEERDTIMTKASELAQHPLLRFSREHFEDLGEMWKTDTHSLVKIRGLLARLSILTAQTAARQYREIRGDGNEIEEQEVLRFLVKSADFAENFNEGYNLSHRLIALSQVIDLYPPRLLPQDGMKFSDWLKIIRNRKVRWTFFIWRIFLGVTLMVWINQWVTLNNFRRVTANMQRLGISGFENEQEAMRVAKAGLRKAFHPAAELDELEGNKLDHYYGRWLGRALAVAGVVVLFSAPILNLIFGLYHLLITAPAVFGVLWSFFSIWRHVGPMLKNLSGDGYGVFKKEIRSLRLFAKSMRKKPGKAHRAPAPRKEIVQARVLDDAGEDLMMTKMKRALLDEDLRKGVEVVILLPPKNGENKQFFQSMAAQDDVLRHFHFEVAESDGLFPGNAGQFFAARDLAKFLGKKEQIYWFPQPGVSFAAAMTVFKMNLAEALRMAGDFRERGVRYGEIIYPGGDLSSNTISYNKNGSQIVIDARLASLNEVEQGRYPVLLGRNGSPRHDVEHVVRRPEELQGALGQYGHLFGTGLTLDNAITPQFAVPKGPLALVAKTDSEHAQMEALITEFRRKTMELLERYGAFEVDLVEDFAGVIAEFDLQLRANNSVPPNLQRLAHNQKTFPDGQSASNPHAKIYGTMGRKLWEDFKSESQNPPEVEAFVPAPADHFYVSGKDQAGILQRMQGVEPSFPELVNRMAVERLERENRSGPADRQVFVFRDTKSRQVVNLPRKQGYSSNLTALKAAAFVTKEGKILFQRRSHLAASNAGLLDLPVFEHLEPGESPEEAVRRGFLEELRDGRPLPATLPKLPVRPLSGISYEVHHERRRQVPTKRKESVEVFHFSLNGEFDWNEFTPGDDAVQVVSYTPDEVLTMYHNKSGIFTPRTYTILKQFLPEIERGLAPASHTGPARSELRRERVFERVVLKGHTSATRNAGDVALEPPFRKKLLREMPASVSETIRLLTAIKITERILGPQDESLLPRLKALLENPDLLLERTGPDLRSLLPLSAEQLLQLQRGSEMFLAVPRQSNAVNTLFLDARIGVRDEHLLLLSRLPFRVIILFERSQSSRRAAIELKIKEMALPAGQFQLVDTTDSVSASILKLLRPRITEAQYQHSDYAFVGTDRREVQKVKGYVGNLVYYDKDLKEYDEDTLFSLLWYLVTSSQLFGLGKKKDVWGIKDAVVCVLESLAESLRAVQRVKQAA